MENEKDRTNNFKILLEKIKKILSVKKIKYIILAVLCVVVVLIFLSSLNPHYKTSTKTQSYTQTKSFWQEYCEAQEHRLEHVLSSIKGVDEVKVFIMVDASPSLSYLENSSKTSSSNQSESFQTTAVEVRNGTITTPVVVVESLPKIIGVLVVAGGATDVKLKNTIANVVSSVMKVNLSGVEVLEGK